MAIEIIKQPDIHLTEDELLKYRRAYRDFYRYRVVPPSFEEFVRRAESVAKAQRRASLP